MSQIIVDSCSQTANMPPRLLQISGSAPEECRYGTDRVREHLRAVPGCSERNVNGIELYAYFNSMAGCVTDDQTRLTWCSSIAMKLLRKRCGGSLLDAAT